MRKVFRKVISYLLIVVLLAPSLAYGEGEPSQVNRSEDLVFNPDDWHIIEKIDNGQKKWVLRLYNGPSTVDTIYIPAVYDNNGEKIEIVLSFHFTIKYIQADRLVIKEVDGKKVKIADTDTLSYGFNQNIKEIDLSGLDTSNVTDMSEMFYYCSRLESLNLSGIDTSNVTDMSGMFKGCSRLKKLDLSGIDTSNVTDMSSMFSGCSSLENLNLNGLDISNVIYMSSMFSGCSSLEELDLSGLNTSNVKYMSSMFSGCSSLKELDLSGLNTSNVETMPEMFSGCSSLESLNLSGLDTSNVKYMSSMFSSCSSLKELDLSGLDTSNVESMNYMFERCRSLEKLDLTHFDTGNVNEFYGMFDDCYNLKELDISKFDLSNNRDSDSVTIKDSYGLESLKIPRINKDQKEKWIDIITNNPIERLDVDLDDDIGDICSSNNFSRFDTVSILYRVFEMLDNIERSIRNSAKPYEKEFIKFIEELGQLEYIDDKDALIENFKEKPIYEDIFSSMEIDRDNYKDIIKILRKFIKEIEEDTLNRRKNIEDTIEYRTSSISKKEQEMIYTAALDDTKDNYIPNILNILDYLDEVGDEIYGGKPLLITTNNPDVFSSCNFKDAKRIPVGLGPKVNAGDIGTFKDGSKESLVYNNKKIVYGRKELEDLTITRDMIDELSFIDDKGDELELKGFEIDGIEKDKYFLEGKKLIEEQGKKYTAIYKPKEHEVIFINGDKKHKIKVRSGERINPDSIPSTDKEGYVFKGWHIKEDDEKRLINIIEKPITRDLELYALYELKPLEYVVSFIDGGNIKNINVLDGEIIEAKDIPATDKEGYDFLGWYEDEDGSGEKFDLSQSITRDIDLYAVYKKNTPQNPVEPEEKPSEPTDPEPGVTKDYKVSFIKDGSEKVVRVEEGKKIKRKDIPATDKEGYDFLGWYENEDGSGEVFNFSQGIYKNTKLYAVYKERVKIESHLAYLKGYEDASLRPLGDMTREEVAMVFYRILDKDYRNKIRSRDHGFRDVEAGRWSEEAIASLAKEGILVGYEDGSFRPGDKISRAELSTILAKLLSSGRTIETEFPDVKGHWAEGYIAIIEEKGWIEGYEDDSFRPDKKIRRNEFTKIINRYLERGVDKENIPGDILEFKDFNKSHKNEWYYEDMVEATNNHRYRELDSKEIWTELFN